jgi:hypothetical protein
MKRRDVLASAGVVCVSALAGCLSERSDSADKTRSGENDDGVFDGKTPPQNDDNSSDDPTPGEIENRRYEECPREIITYEQFPADIQTEIDAALDGGYEADHVFLREAMDPSRSFVSVDDQYYEATVTVTDGTERLELDGVEPKELPRPRSVSVELKYGTERTITLELIADDGTVLFEESRSMYEGGEVEFGEVRRVGTHTLRVTVADGETTETETTETLMMNESRFSVLVVIEDNGVSVTGSIADLIPCQFDS